MSLDVDDLRVTYQRACAAIRQNPVAGLPSWTHSVQPGDLFKRPIISVATENLESVIDYLDRHANVVAIVNDFAIGKRFGRHYCVSSSDALNSCPEAIFVNSTVLGTAQQHFYRVAAAAGMPALSLLEYCRLLRHVDGLKIPVSPFGLLEAYDILAFFDAAIQDEPHYLRIERQLDDKISAVTLYGLLNQRLTGDTEWHRRIGFMNTGKPYGSDVYIFNSRYFELTDDEIYIDAGAYRGDTLLLFADSVHDRFRRIHAFEPDPANFGALQETVMKRFGKLQKRAICHQVGLWECPGRMRMRATDAEGAMNVATHLEFDPSEGTNVHDGVPVTSIDECLVDEVPTFIKFEIEGSEEAALRGSCKTIARHRPKIALSSYHRPHDLVVLFDLMQSIDAGYRIGLQHHKESVAASVYYCAPR